MFRHFRRIFLVEWRWRWKWGSSFFDEWLFYYFWVYYFSKTAETLSPRNATICSLFESRHDNYENWNSMRYKWFKFDVNSIYESQKFNSIRFFFTWRENVNAIEIRCDITLTYELGLKCWLKNKPNFFFYIY